MIGALVVVAAVAAATPKAPPPKGAEAKGAAAPRAAPPVVDVLDDGTTIVVRRVPGAPQVSVRYVVRAGGEADPPGKAGLAHLLEHLIFHGTYEEPEGALFEQVWGVGGNLNAYTSAEWTTYVLDVPRASFSTMTAAMLSTVTAPALPFASIEREKGVVGAEDADRPDLMTISYALDQLIFPSHNGGLTVIGTEESRKAITLDDLQEFHARHYVPKNSVLVVAGDVFLDDVRAAAAEGLKSPPQLAPPPPFEPPSPNLPSEAKGASWVTVTAQARLVDGASRGACEAAAGLLELRLRRRVIAVERLVADVFGTCLRQRGHDLIVLAVVTSSPESSQLPDWLNEVYLSTTRVPPSPQEKAIVESRRKALLTRSLGSPEGFADAVMFALASPDLDVEAAVKSVTSPAPLAWGSVAQVLSAGASPSKLSQLHFSRFEH